MQFQFSFKHMDTSPALQTYAEAKLRERIAKFVSKPIAAHLMFSVQRHQHTAHLSLEAGDGFDLQVEHTSEDMYATVDQLVDKLTRQLQKHKEKLKEHKGQKLGSNLIDLSVDLESESPVDAADILKFEQGRRRASR
jgi:putative sigma-54 modulation protein